MARRRTFTIQKLLRMSIYDFAEISPKHYDIKLLVHNTDGSYLYEIVAYELVHLVELLCVLNCNDQIGTLQELVNVKAQMITT